MINSAARYDQTAVGERLKRFEQNQANECTGGRHKRRREGAVIGPMLKAIRRGFQRKISGRLRPRDQMRWRKAIWGGSSARAITEVGNADRVTVMLDVEDAETVCAQPGMWSDVGTDSRTAGRAERGRGVGQQAGERLLRR